MSGIQNALTDPLVEVNIGQGHDAVLERALYRRRVLAWSLSSLTLALTLGFFAMMTLAAPLLSRVVFGHYVTLANVLAVGVIVLFLVSIAVFGWYATRIDVLLQASARPDRD